MTITSTESIMCILFSQLILQKILHIKTGRGNNKYYKLIFYMKFHYPNTESIHIFQIDIFKLQLLQFKKPE